MIKEECRGCLSWDSRNNMCLRVAHGMACVVSSRPGAITWLPEGQSPADYMATQSKARDTQVAGDHYKQMGVEPWDVVDTWPLEQRIGAYRHGALKYLMRAGSKDERAQEIRKAEHYCQKLAEVLEKAQEPA